MQPLSERPSLIVEAYRSLLAAIADGRLPPGTRVTQEELAESLQVSRQPVSHALALLKQEGFLVETGRRGLVVAPLDPDYVKAHYEVRAALDAAAARLAAARVAGGLPSAALQRALAAGEGALEAGDRAALAAADMDFHRALNQLSGNPVILETAERQWGHIRRAMGAVLEDRSKYRLVWQEHAAIARAIAGGQPREAEQLARAHAERAGRETYTRLLAAMAAPAAE